MRAPVLATDAAPARRVRQEARRDANRRVTAASSRDDEWAQSFGVLGSDPDQFRLRRVKAKVGNAVAHEKASPHDGEEHTNSPLSKLGQNWNGTPGKLPSRNAGESTRPQGQR